TFSGEPEVTSTVEAREAEDHRAPGALQRGTDPRQEGRPEFSGPCPTYEMSERTRAAPYGGLAAVHQLVRQAGLPQMIDSQLGILKRARPYQDSDHVLNIAYNILCGGQVLD